MLVFSFQFPSYFVFVARTDSAAHLLLYLNRLRALKTRQIKEERLAAQMEKGWEGRAGGLEIRLPPADGATGASGGARSRHAMTGGDTADDMVAMQRRAAREGVNPEFTESPLFPRPKR